MSVASENTTKAGLPSCFAKSIRNAFKRVSSSVSFAPNEDVFAFVDALDFGAFAARLTVGSLQLNGFSPSSTACACDLAQQKTAIQVAGPCGNPSSSSSGPSVQFRQLELDTVLVMEDADDHFCDPDKLASDLSFLPLPQLKGKLLGTRLQPKVSVSKLFFWMATLISPGLQSLSTQQM